MGTRKRTVMLVDDNVTNLVIGKNALGEMYNVLTIPSGEKLFRVLDRIIPDIILLDVEMPDMDGYDVIRRLKEDERTASIPVVFLTARSDTSSELAGFSLGALDYITKPFSPPVLRKRVESHLLLIDYNHRLLDMVEEKTRAITELQSAVLSTIGEIVEYRDIITGNHIERTRRFLTVVVEELLRRGLYKEPIESWNLEFLYRSAALHDVGKIAIRDSVLMKPSRLNHEEFEQMKMHPEFGVKIIEKIEKSTTERDFLHHAKIFAATHHEFWDGSGYPKGLRGTAIPLQGRLMAIVDVYDALISERPYKKALPHPEAIEIIKSENGTHFEPELVEVLLDRAEELHRIAVSLTGKSDT